MSRQSSKGFARRSPGEPNPSPHAKDADWGFEQQGSERVLEPKLGILLVTALVLMFGFVFYQKLQSTPSESSQARAGERQPSAGDLENELPIVAEGADHGSPFATGGTAVTESPFPPDDAMSDPFLAANSAPPKSARVGRADTAGQTSRTRVGGAPGGRTPGREEYNPFASSADPFADDADQAGGPPPQSEPNPFQELPDEVPAQQDAPAFGSAESLDAGLYFEDEPRVGPSHGSSAAVDNSPWPAEGPASSRTSVKPGHQGVEQFEDIGQFEDARQFEVNAPNEPNPFAQPPSSREPAFEAARRVPSPQEPQAFPSSEFSAPIPSQQHEPNPFEDAGSDSHVATDDGTGEPTENPFFDASANERKPLSAPGWDPAGAPHGNQLPPPHERARTLDAPAVPGLPAEPDPFADSARDWDASPAAPSLPSLPPVEEPGKEFVPAAGHRPVSSQVSVVGGPVPVIGEQEVSVQRNDSLWSICREAYGTGKYLSALARYNRDRVPDPNKLKVGIKIRIPPPEILEAQFPELFGGAARRDASVTPAGGVSSTPRPPQPPGLYVDSTGRPHYRTGKSDTLIQIARQYLGRPTRWTEILDMNRHQLPNAESLKPGMILRMPADARPVSVVNGRPPGR